jgi:hypothetical protein
MLLAEWLKELGAPMNPGEVARSSLTDIKGFIFSEDAYFVEMHDSRKYQDNDLVRLLSMIRDEFHTHNTTAILKGGERLHPQIEFPFQKGKQQMFVRPVVWTAAIPPPDLDLILEQLERNVTYFNLSGSFQPPMHKDNL